MSVEEQEFKHIVLADSAGLAEAEPKARELLAKGLPVEILHVDEWSASALYKYLSEQSMGTKIVLAVGHTRMRKLRRILEEIGYGRDEVRYISVGSDVRRAFCAKCQHIFAAVSISNTICPMCGQKLAISQHYSSRLDALFGVVELPAVGAVKAQS